ncbi:hypothetical protein U5B43_07280 [Campylobacter sp. 9BO]|uniref:hypothetical protein n=1 Tax=Campylobacter sp. 9BO TaxID=3424759 RepID=UPI003D34D154
MKLDNYLSNLDNISVEIAKEMSQDELAKAKKLFSSYKFDPNNLLPIKSVTLKYIGKTPKARIAFISKQEHQELIRFYALYLLAKSYEIADVTQYTLYWIGGSYRGFAEGISYKISDLTHEKYCDHAYYLLKNYR